MIITGASSGIGEATARAAAGRGARVVLAARRADRLSAIASDLPGALAVPTDMRDAEQIHALVATTVAEHGRVDVLVNNAGQGLHVALERVSLTDFAAITALNVYGPLIAMQAVIGPMRARHAGTIINVSSGASRRLVAGVGAYAATKAALNVLSEVARAELASDGITVSTVLPVITATEFHDRLRGGHLAPERSRSFVPDSPAKVAQVILALIDSGEREATLFPARQSGAGRGGLIWVRGALRARRLRRGRWQ